ncbi:MAG: sodium:solute symporter [Thermogutta sp.]
MANIDWLVIAGYFVVLFGLAWWVILKGKDTADDYFLAGRNLGWFVVGASIFASNIGSEHLVGLAGSGCTDGVAMAHYELHAWCLLILAWVFVPFYLRSKVFTMPEFLERRFSPGARWLLSLISLVAYVLTKIAVGIFAGGIVFQTLLPDVHVTVGPYDVNSFWVGSFAVIILTGLYTVLGGMRAVAYTEALQTFILVIGSALVTIFGLRVLGGWSGLREVCGGEMFNLWKPLAPAGWSGTWKPVLDESSKTMAWYFNSNYPWLGMLICAPISGLWYWCTDQYIVQRCLGAPSEKEARRGAIWAAILKLLPVFIFIIPGMICLAVSVSGRNEELTRQFFTAELEKALSRDPQMIAQTKSEVKPIAVGRVTVPGGERREVQGQQVVTNGKVAVVGGEAKQTPDGYVVTGGKVYVNSQSTQAAFPLMVRYVLPPGVRGIVVAGLLAALMSSLAGVFNASSTLFTMDFYSKLRPSASQSELVWTGRMATTAMVVIGLAWIPVIQGARGLYDYLQSVQGYLAPPIFTVFFLGVFWKRLNAKGCLWALAVGFALGVFRLAVDTPVKLFGVTYPEGSFLWIVNNIFFQYFAVLIFAVSVIVMIAASYLSSPPDEAKISGLTYGTITEEQRRESRSTWNAVDVLASAFVLAAIIAAYLYFRG